MDFQRTVIEHKVLACRVLERDVFHAPFENAVRRLFKTAPYVFVKLGLIVTMIDGVLCKIFAAFGKLKVFDERFDVQIDRHQLVGALQDIVKRSPHLPSGAIQHRKSPDCDLFEQKPNAEHGEDSDGLEFDETSDDSVPKTDLCEVRMVNF